MADEQTLTISDLEHIIEISDKKRHEIKGDKIRALYGHSIPMHISKEVIVPPDILYHGTTHKALDSILCTGLKPMGRQYVHLSINTDIAMQVGRRRERSPVLLKIDSAAVYKNGIAFYTGNDKVVLADNIPSQYIDVL